MDTLIKIFDFIDTWSPWLCIAVVLAVVFLTWWNRSQNNNACLVLFATKETSGHFLKTFHRVALVHDAGNYITCKPCNVLWAFAPLNAMGEPDLENIKWREARFVLEELYDVYF